MKKLYNLIFLVFLSIQYAYCQFTLDGEFRPRTEYRHGFGNPIAEEADPGFATSTRLRLNVGYKVDAYTFYASVQDVLVWGENRQLRPDDENDSFALFEAWAAVNLGDGWQAKLGRQTLSYDDQRILGAVGWVQQARNHDLALIKYNKDKFRLDLGIGFNQDFDNPSGFQSVGNTFTTTGFFTPKTMQFVYAKQAWNNFWGSLLFLNTGFQELDMNGDGDGLSNLQTFGTHLNYKKNGFGATFNGFLQTGTRQGGLDVNTAFLAGLDVSYKVSKGVGLGLGAELISGNDGQTIGETSAFFPIFGTNHKFNGFLDYFFVGNHANSVGLFDVHASANFNLGSKSSLLIKVLNFSGEEALVDGDRSLGTEVDIVFSKTFKGGYNLKLGYSQIFATEGLYNLRGLTDETAADIQNWAWAMLTIKPKFLNTAKAK